MGFTKLDEGILRSSIMAEPSDVFKVWIAFLAACGPDGIARTSSIFISSVCRLGLDIVHEAIEHLEAPDPESRTETDEGRRIRRVGGGWFIVNYKKYRAFQYSEEPDAIRKRKYRKRVKRDMSGTCPGRSASASASASALSLRKRKEEKIERGCDSPAKVHLMLDDEPKRWEGITPELKALWAKSYPGCDVEAVLQEMIAYWDAQPAAKRKLNWKRTIVNRLKWLQDHGGTNRGTPRGNAPGTWLKMMKEKEAKK
ncbi:MAG: hypothetical protein A2Y86_05235 [Candidatus Aminicenantes bacterium RBG_13_62_12]|nr:MAG: hypothetical protein A2Y86_05235 [Candidatus Aminicenantes bacterium RBG_13_62_12]